MMDDYLSLAEAAELLGVHPNTMRRWADSGFLKCEKTKGGHRRWKRTDLLFFRDTQLKIKKVIYVYRFLTH